MATRARGNKLRIAIGRIANFLRAEAGPWQWTQHGENGKPWHYTIDFQSAAGVHWPGVLAAFTRMEDDGALDRLLGGWAAQWAAVAQPKDTRKVKERVVKMLSQAQSWSTAVHQATGKIRRFADEYREEWGEGLIKHLLLSLGENAEWIPPRKWKHLSDKERMAVAARRSGLQRNIGKSKKPKRRVSSSSTSKPKGGIRSSSGESSRKRGPTKSTTTKKRSSMPSGKKPASKARKSMHGTGGGTISFGRSKSHRGAGSKLTVKKPGPRPTKK